MRQHWSMNGDGSFAERLRRLRESAGLTQEELAGRAGLSAKAVSLLERGERTRPYPNTVTSLAEALGLEPAQRVELLASARRGGTGSGRAAAGVWPVPPTPLVGRDREVRELAELLTRPSTRLVTLTGTGGVGKTRLALGVLPEVAAAFPDGVAFVPLAPVAAADLVLPTLVRALKLSDAAREPRDVLRAHLVRRRMLLALDNLEHVLDAAADLATLLELPDGPVVLATSRAPLHLRGEVEYAVAPLWVPETERPSAEAVIGSPAGRVFTERARAASPAFDLTEENAADVAAICRRLAGLPLALEIVAARIRFLGPAQVLSRLDQALHEEGARDLPARQRTLRRALDWSYDLLDSPDRLLFARLSVFAGGFTLEAAEAVGRDPGVGHVLAGLGHLVSHSLALAEAVSGDGTVRYRMLEPVRQYAAERLVDTGEADETRLAHAEHFLALAEDAYPRIEAAEQIEWLDRLSVENDNLRSAITWTVASGRSELAVRFGWALRMYWLMRDRREEGRLLMEQAFRDAEAMPDPVRARLLHVLAFCYYGFRGPQRRLAEEGVELFRRVGDSLGEEYALGMLGFALLVEEDFDKATMVLEQALTMATERGDHANAAHLLNHLAVVPLRRGDRDAAAALAEQALAHTRRTGERLARQTALQVLGQMAWSAGEDGRARQLFLDSLEVALDLADTVNVAYSLRGLALADGSGGRSSASAGLLGAADGLLEQAGFPVFAWVVGGLDDAAAEAVRVGAGDKSWQAAHGAGRAAQLDDVVESALQTSPDGPAWPRSDAGDNSGRRDP